MERVLLMCFLHVTMILLFALLLITQVASFGSQCGGLDHRLFSAENRVLKNYTYQRKTVPNHVMCGRDCSMDKNCKSFNFYKFPKQCELNNAKRAEHPDDFVQDQQGVYFDDDKTTLLYTSTEPTTPYPSTEPTTAYPSTEPTAAYPSTEPTAAYPSTEPTTAYPSTEPLTRYKSCKQLLECRLSHQAKSTQSTQMDSMMVYMSTVTWTLMAGDGSCFSGGWMAAWTSTETGLSTSLDLGIFQGSTGWAMTTWSVWPL